MVEQEILWQQLSGKTSKIFNPGMKEYEYIGEKMKLIMGLVICFISLTVYSDEKRKIVIPIHTKMQYEQLDPQNHKLHFTGSLPLRGLLRIYWARTYRNDKNPNEKELIWYFVPDSAGQNALPFINDTYNKPKKLIRLYFPLPPLPDPAHPDENYLHKRIKDLFLQTPENFWKYQEGFLEGAVALEFDYFDTFIECDSRHYEGRISWRFNPIADTDAVFPKSLGSLSINLEDTYEIQSQTGFANLYSQPKMNAGSTILSKLANGALLVNLGSIDDQWFYIQAIDQDKNKSVLKGYIQKNQVTPYSP